MKILLCCFLIPGFILSSCKQEEEVCMPDPLETIIVGKWRVTSHGFSDGDVEFMANGTFLDDNEALVFNTIGASDVVGMTYIIDSNTRFRIRVDIVTDKIDYIVQVADFTCREINLSITGLDYTLKKR
jgi:hypothetical protein